jgi:glyoxylase-like metal-dependent hydrolase (beta-lactamase superfamily II)
MKQVLPRIWQWSWFSPEKQLDFNGHLLAVGEHRILIDPPPMDTTDRVQARQGGQIDYIIITNRDHGREVETLRNEFQCQVLVPELDAKEMNVQPTKTYADGELLPGGIWVVHLADQKSPGECALFLQQGNGIMIVGDALIGNPPGGVSLLPPEKYADASKARTGLQRLLKYNFDSLLVGDGASLLTGAKAVVQDVLQET